VRTTSIVGWESAWQTFDPSRLQILDFRSVGLTPDGTYGFWPMLIGGIFLYASYYGCDQSQVQRELSVGNLRDVRRSLLVNAFGRFPVVLLYCVMGVLVGAVFAFPDNIPQIAAKLGMETSSVTAVLQTDPDRMVPMFILTYLPAGVVGLLFVSILSALMSSLDSAINSLSAVTMKDFYRPLVKSDASEKHYLVASKIITMGWGLFCILAALMFSGAGESTRQTTIVLINAVGSLLYGPILAAFLTGMLVRWVNSTGIKSGVLFGIVINILLWQATSISWLWWNVTGFVATALVALTMSAAQPVSSAGELSPKLIHSMPESGTRLTVVTVVTYFLAILVISFAIQYTA
jgi:Na+/proline symporter